MSSHEGTLPRASSALNPKVVVATTVALSFISFWRGASIVLADPGLPAVLGRQYEGA